MLLTRKVTHLLGANATPLNRHGVKSIAIFQLWAYQFPTGSISRGQPKRSPSVPQSRIRNIDHAADLDSGPPRLPVSRLSTRGTTVMPRAELDALPVELD